MKFTTINGTGGAAGVNCFALTAKAKAEAMRKVDRACAAYYVIIASLFNTSNTAMVDAVELLKPVRRLWQGNARSGARKALRCYDDWNRRMKATLKDRYGLWLDVSDKTDALMRPHVRNLFYAFDAVLLKHGVADHAAKAMTETAGVLSELCVEMFDKYFDGVERQAGVSMRGMFCRHFFTGCRTYWDDARKAVCGAEAAIDFNADPRCALAYKVLVSKAMDEGLYNAAGEYGLRVNGMTEDGEG